MHALSIAHHTARRRFIEEMTDGDAEVKGCAPEADDDERNDEKPVSGKLPQSQRPGGKKRMVAAFVAFVGAGYSVSMSRSLFALHKRCCP